MHDRSRISALQPVRERIIDAEGKLLRRTGIDGHRATRCSGEDNFYGAMNCGVWGVDNDGLYMYVICMALAFLYGLFIR